MLCSTVHPLTGEAEYIVDATCSFPSAGVCILSQQSGDKRQAVTVPASLSLTSYRLVVSPLNCSSETTQHGTTPVEACMVAPPVAISVPILSVERWRIVIDTSSALVESFARSRHALQCHLSHMNELHTRASSSTLPHTGENASGDVAATATEVNDNGDTGAPLSHAGSRSFYVLTIQTKHVFSLRLLFPCTPQSQNTLNTFKALMVEETVYQQGRLNAVPAFSFYSKEPTKAVSSPDTARMDTVEFGWTLYDPAFEAVRQMCTTDAYREPTHDKASCDGPVSTPVRVGHDLRSRFHWLSLDQGTGGYSASPTYPRKILEPVDVDSALLHAALEARGRARVPAVTYVHLGTGAVLARASQPLSRSAAIPQDAQICRALINHPDGTDRRPPPPQSADPPTTKGVARPTSSLFDDDNPVPRIGVRAEEPASPAPPITSPAVISTGGGRGTDQLRVVDCRPWKAAVANAQLGGGYETGSVYSFCEVEFSNIENVFAVAASFQKLRALLESFDGDQPDEGFCRRLHETQWLAHIQRVLVASVRVADVLDRPDGASCLVHCTDGWDRTAQCTAAAQLILDPFYRTTVGFCILMEKEFASFGHKFAERCAHQRRGHTSYATSAGVSGSDTEKGHELQVSPVWVQFMDVVYQIMRQSPEDFEFTTALPEYLSVVVYSGLYGTFLCNCEQERELEGVRLRTRSVWTDVVRRVQAEKQRTLPLCFLNESYDAKRAWGFIRRRPCPPGKARRPFPTTNAPDEVVAGRLDGLDPLDVHCNAKHLSLWEALYFRGDSDRLLQPRRQRLSRLRAQPPRATAEELGLWACTPPSSASVSPTDSGAAAAAEAGAAWRVDMESYLQAFIDSACGRRVDEMEHLTQVQVTSPRPYATGVQESVWGTFDVDVCFRCYKLSTLWVGLKKRSVCADCGQSFCSQCYTDHHCRYQAQRQSGE